MELVGGDADDGAVFFVPLADLEDVLAAADGVVVELDPQCHGW